MKNIIVGLGNPGEQYLQSRHNLGFLFLDYLQNALALEPFIDKKKFKATVSVNQDLVLLKPQTFMNLSGEAVQSAYRFFCDGVNLSADKQLQNLVVAHDDLDLEFGQYKLQFATGPKDHNGLLSIYHQLGTNLFWHLRIGADDRAGSRQVPVENYVLQKLPTVQLEQLQELFGEMKKSLSEKKLVNY